MATFGFVGCGGSQKTVALNDIPRLQRSKGLELVERMNQTISRSSNANPGKMSFLGYGIVDRDVDVDEFTTWRQAEAVYLYDNPADENEPKVARLLPLYNSRLLAASLNNQK